MWEKGCLFKKPAYVEDLEARCQGLELAFRTLEDRFKALDTHLKYMEGQRDAERKQYYALEDYLKIAYVTHPAARGFYKPFPVKAKAAVKRKKR